MCKIVACLIAVTVLAGATAGSAMQRRASTNPSFTLDISLSPRAAAELARRGERLEIVTYFQGTPSRRYRHLASDDGLISLGDERTIAPGRAGRVVVSGRSFQAGRLSWLESGEADVTVNITSARRSHRDNLLNCGLVAGRVWQISYGVHPVRCALIGE